MPQPVDAAIAISHDLPARHEPGQSAAFFDGAQYVVDAATLHTMLDQPNLKIVDVRTLSQCPDGHIPRAVQLDYARLVRREGDVEGLLPTPGELTALLGELGISPEHFVVAYDDDTGSSAARLLWALDVIGHRRYALLTGGFSAWDEAGFDVVDAPCLHPADYYPVGEYGPSLVSVDEVRAAIDNPDQALVDTRTVAEYEGRDIRAARGGHVPGAIHFDWERAVELHENGELRERDALLEELSGLGLTPDRPVITYCQSNRRSAHTFVVLKWLGFDRVGAYAGSWSEWGNDCRLPVEH